MLDSKFTHVKSEYIYKIFMKNEKFITKYPFTFLKETLILQFYNVPTNFDNHETMYDVNTVYNNKFWFSNNTYLK